MYPLGFHGWTQKRRILWLLREANRSGDGYAYLDQLIELCGYTFRNRVSELRNQEGYEIQCIHDRIAGWKYHLNDTKQMRMVI